MFCNKCGFEVEDGANFCPMCGVQFQLNRQADTKKQNRKKQKTKKAGNPKQKILIALACVCALIPIIMLMNGVA